MSAVAKSPIGHGLRGFHGGSGSVGSVESVAGSSEAA